jgi:CBS domain-containing protein
VEYAFILVLIAVVVVVTAAVLAGIVAGAVAGGAVGGLAGLLHGMGVPDQEAAYYEGEFKGGKSIVTVRADERREEAADIMRQLGAYDARTRPAGGPISDTVDRVVESPADASRPVRPIV